jgi:aspartate carbamoyltransferase catalytic subunit
VSEQSWPDLPAGLRRHLIAISDLDRDAIERILETAASFESVLDREVKKLPTLRGRTILSVFFEASTRTASSFELAAKRLSADTMTLKASGSSIEKGESLRDTIQTLAAYGPDVVVLRHPHAGAAQLATAYTTAHIVNAGDGKHQHPTQCLLDLYTIREALGRLDGVSVAIVGDILHSRVARSNIEGFTAMGMQVLLVGPPTLIPRGIEQGSVRVSTDIRDIHDVDVVYVLRMQRERMGADTAFVPTLREYTAQWGVTAERVSPRQIIMHPGPINRGVELDPQLADAAQSRILRQVQAGLVTRMAVLYDLITRPSTEATPAPSPAAEAVA